MGKVVPLTLKNTKVLSSYVRASYPYRWLYALHAGAVILCALLSIISPLYYKKFFDLLAISTPENISFWQLFYPVIIASILNFIVFLGSRVQGLTINYLEPRVMNDLKQNSFKRLMNHSHNFFTNNFVGSLVQKVGRYSRSYERIVDRAVFDIIPIIVKITGMLIALWIVSESIFFVVATYVTLFILSQHLYSKWKLPYDVEIAELDSKVTGVLADAITNHSTIQSFASKSYEEKLFAKVADEQFRFYWWGWNRDEMLRAFHHFIGIATEVIFFIFGLIAWQKGLFSLGSFVLVQAYLSQMNNSLWSMGRVFRDLYSAVGDAKEMVDILELPNEIPDKVGAKGVMLKEGAVRYEDVKFVHKGGREVFKDFTLDIKAGEKVAFVGPSGAGKSTLVKLLFRFFDVDGGRVTIDEYDVRDITQESVRKAVAYVPQDPLLFHRTLLENIRYGKRGASDAETKEAARLAHCDEFIKELPLGYETLVGERGVKLSGGERQRVAIARALLKDAPILVLDEATSSLDSHSESLIQDALDTLMKGRTTIVIAHRLSTIRKMDRIVVLQDGKIVEDGSHDELLTKRGGLYKKLWKLQAGGFIQ